MGTSFKEKTRDRLIQGAKEYSGMTEYLYIFESDKFKLREIYILKFDITNYKHLTGVTSRLSAKDFYNKCLHGELEMEDFDCESSKERKGFIRKKMRHIGNISKALMEDVDIEEKYERGRVIALLALSNGEFTLAFTGGSTLNPMSLLDGMTLHKEKKIKGVIAKRYKI